MLICRYDDYLDEDDPMMIAAGSGEVTPSPTSQGHAPQNQQQQAMAGEPSSSSSSPSSYNPHSQSVPINTTSSQSGDELNGQPDRTQRYPRRINIPPYLLLPTRPIPLTAGYTLLGVLRRRRRRRPPVDYRL